MKLLEFKNQAQFLESFASGELKGALPQEKIDTNTLKYPVRVWFNVDLRIFWLYNETPAEPQTQSTKKKLSKKAILGLSIGIPCGAALIIAIVLVCVFLSGCAHYKARCVKWDKNGICTAEQIIYKKATK